MIKGSELRYARTKKCGARLVRSGKIRRSAFTLAAALAIFSGTAFAQSTDRARAVGQKLFCVCGCGQILISCNHVGCPYSHGMIKELDDRVARNESEDLTIQGFVQEYGPNVLAEPPAKGFNWAAWAMPVLVPMGALIILWQVLRTWRQRSAISTPAGAPDISSAALIKAREESENDHE
jgi:cytochrome c-type biogenesis protein CcmH